MDYEMKLSLRQMTLNALFAAVYTVITIFLPSYGALQLRLSEMFAHLPLFNKKYSVGDFLHDRQNRMRCRCGI